MRLPHKENRRSESLLTSTQKNVYRRTPSPFLLGLLVCCSGLGLVCYIADHVYFLPPDTNTSDARAHKHFGDQRRGLLVGFCEKQVAHQLLNVLTKGDMKAKTANNFLSWRPSKQEQTTHSGNLIRFAYLILIQMRVQAFRRPIPLSKTQTFEETLLAPYDAEKKWPINQPDRYICHALFARTQSESKYRLRGSD